MDNKFLLILLMIVFSIFGIFNMGLLYFHSYFFFGIVLGIGFLIAKKNWQGDAKLKSISLTIFTIFILSYLLSSYFDNYGEPGRDIVDEFVDSYTKGHIAHYTYSISKDKTRDDSYYINANIEKQNGTSSLLIVHLIRSGAGSWTSVDTSWN
jgi:hypothetical protein